jgi:hypothetical protein
VCLIPTKRFLLFDLLLECEWFHKQAVEHLVDVCVSSMIIEIYGKGGSARDISIGSSYGSLEAVYAAARVVHFGFYINSKRRESLTSQPNRSTLVKVQEKMLRHLILISMVVFTIVEGNESFSML